MKIRENIVVVTAEKTYEDCSCFKFSYKKGVAKELFFSCNKGSLGVEIDPKLIKDCYDKETGINFMSELTSSFVMPECTDTLGINQDVFRGEIKRFLLK